MATIENEKDLSVVRCSEDELLFLHQAFSEICYGDKSLQSELAKDYSSEELHAEFEKFKKLYSDAKIENFTVPIKFTATARQINLYKKAVMLALKEFEGEVQTRTGVKLENAEALLSSLK